MSGAVAVAGPSPEQAELAERLMQTGQRLASVAEGRGVAVATALADAAEQMFENDARLLRTAADLRLALGDRDRALALLTAYRKIDPGDQIAQVQSIDLQQSKLQSATERADYLTRVAASERLAAEVRSHAAVLLAGVESERGRDAAVTAAVAQALGLNPLNPKALQMRADAAAASGNAAERTTALVNLLLADPLQFPTASRLGEELMRAGLVEQATEFYGKFMDAVAAAGYAPGPDDSINAASLMQMAGHDREAVDIASDALKDDPSDLRLHGLRLLLTKAANDDAGFKTALADARTQAVRNLMGLHTQVDAKAPKPDDATPVALPDVKADAAAVKAGGDAKLSAAYVRGLDDLAWLDVYYGGRATDPAVTEAINTLAGPDSPLAHRLAGWAALAADRADEADVAFSPVAANDPLSRLGLLSLRLKQGKDKSAVLAEAGKLLGELPTDVWPMAIRQTVKDAGPPTARAADAAAVAAAYARLPKDILGFAGAGRSTFLVDIDPLGGGVEIGQPILVRVTLQNTSSRPLAIGPGTGVQQQVALDATVRGIAEQPFPGVAVAKMTQRLVVRSKESISTVVRLDSVELATYLNSVPQAGTAVFVSGVTNPVARQNALVPGPGGYRVQGRGVIDRPQVAFNRPETREMLARQLASPDAVRRSHAVTAIGACGRFYGNAAAGDDNKPLVAQAVDMLRQAGEKDASPTVRAFARQELMNLAASADRMAGIAAMMESPDAETRLLGTLMTVQANRAEREKLLKSAVNDADPVVQRLAKAVADLPEPTPPPKPAAK